jgi:NADPH2:quinone reductase
VQITRFGGPEVLDVVDLPEPTPGEGQKLYDVSTAGVNYADTHTLYAVFWSLDTEPFPVTVGPSR